MRRSRDDVHEQSLEMHANDGGDHKGRNTLTAGARRPTDETVECSKFSQGKVETGAIAFPRFH